MRRELGPIDRAAGPDGPPLRDLDGIAAAIRAAGIASPGGRRHDAGHVPGV